MGFQYRSVRTQAKSTKGYGLAWHGSRAHLHILMRIDMLLPCLHDPSCLFICAGFSVVIMSRYRPVPQSRWHLLCRDYKWCVFLVQWKKNIFLAPLRIKWDKCKRKIWKKKETKTFLFSFLRPWNVCALEMREEFSVFSLIVHRERLSCCSSNMRAEAERNRGSIFQQLCRVTRRCRRYRCSKWQLQLVWEHAFC